MTGYGAGTAEDGGTLVEVEIYSVNHRGLSVQINGPREWGALESELTPLLRQKMDRGKLSVSISASRVSSSGKETVDWESVDKRVGEFREARRRFGETEASGDSIPPEVLYRILHDSAQDGQAPEWESTRQAVFDATGKALSGLITMRTEEGMRLAGDFVHRTDILRKLLADIKERDKGRIPNHRDALLARLKEMKLELDVTDERVAREVAFFADRSDISEEITRVESHLTALAQCFDCDQPTGRRLEFLLQEILREFNTMGSKSSLPGISTAVIDGKQEIEKLREQAANIE